MPEHANGAGRLALAAVAASLLALGVSACSGSSKNPADTPTSSSTTTTAGSATPSAASVPGVPGTVPTMEELYQGTEQPPPSSGPAAVHGRSVVFVSCGQLSEGCAGPAAGAQEAAQKLGWRFSITDAKFNVAGGFAAAVRQAIAEKPNAIILYGYDCSYGQQALEEAKAQGIVLEGLTIKDCGTGKNALLSVNPTYTSDISTNDEYWARLGAMEAAYVIDQTSNKAKSILLDQTDSSAPTAAGSKAMFDMCASCQIVQTIGATAAEYAPASQMVHNFALALAKHPEVNSLVLNYDTALYLTGLAQQLKSNQSGRNLTVVASGGTSAGMNLLGASHSPYTGAIAYDTHWLGWASMDVLNRYFAHSAQAPEGTGFRLVTTKNLSAVTKASNGSAGGRYISPIDYEAVYDKVWSGAGN